MLKEKIKRFYNELSACAEHDWLVESCKNFYKDVYQTRKESSQIIQKFPHLDAVIVHPSYHSKGGTDADASILETWLREQSDRARSEYDVKEEEANRQRSLLQKALDELEIAEDDYPEYYKSLRSGINSYMTKINHALDHSGIAADYD